MDYSVVSARCDHSPRPVSHELRTRRARLACAIAVGLGLLALIGGCDRPMSIERVRESQAAGRYAETIEALRERLESMPDDAETNLLYGRALAQTGSGRVAVWSLRKAAENPGLAIEANLELAGAQARVGNWKEAIAAAETVLELEPDNLPARILRGSSHLSEGEKLDEALEDFDAVLEKDPTSVAALTARASVLLLQDKIDDAAETIDQIEALAEKNTGDDESQAQLCAVQAVLRQERDQIEEAEKRFGECLERFPADAAVVDAAITFFDERGQSDRSDAVLEKALELAPHSLSYRRTLALRKEAAGDSKRALEIFEQGLETEDRELEIAVLTDLTNYHLDRDELPQAIERFEQALALTSKPTQTAVLSHADMLARAGRHEDARRVAKDLENKSFVRLIEARIALDEDQPKRALEELDAVFPSWPNNAGARYYAARAAEQMGDFARAIEEYRQSIRSAPDQTEAALRLAKLYRAAGIHSECWSNAWQYAGTFNDDPEGARTLVSCADADEKATLQGLLAQTWGGPLWPAAVATRMHFMAERRGAKGGLEWLANLPGPKPALTDPRLAELLREKVRWLVASGSQVEAEKIVAEALAAHPDNGALMEVRAFLLESSGAPQADVLAAFEAASSKDAKSWLALEGLARARERAGDLAGAIEAYDRSTQIHPESPEAARQAALLAAKAGSKPEEVERRWHALLKEHPWDAGAAEVYARLRLDRGEKGTVTLDFAERAVLFGGGKEAEKLLVALHDARNEHERARQVERAFADGKPIPPRPSGRRRIEAGAATAAGRAPTAEPAGGPAQKPAPASPSNPGPAHAPAAGQNGSGG